MRKRFRAGLILIALLAGACSAEVAQAATFSNWAPDVASARTYAQQRQGSVRFSIIGIHHRVYNLQASKTAPAASVFKGMLLTTYLRMRSVRNRSLNHNDRSLLVPMIRRSDSVAATRVRDIVGQNRIEKLAHDAGMHNFQYNSVWGLSRTSPRDQVRFMYHLDRFIPKSHRSFARYQLAHIVPSQRWGVGQVPLHGWRLYFKGGWGSASGRVDHQVACLEKGTHRISLAIFTEFDPNHAYGKATLEGVARRLLKGLPN